MNPDNQNPNNSDPVETQPNPPAPPTVQPPMPEILPAAASTETPQPSQPLYNPEQLVSQAEPEAESSTMHEIPKKKSSILVILIILLIFTSISSLAYWMYQKQQASPVSSPEPSAQVVIPTPDVTANWKTYEDTKNKFSIRYPESYSLESGSATQTVYINKNIELSISTVSTSDCRGDCPVVESAKDVQIDNISAKKMEGYLGEIGGNIPQRFVIYEINSQNKYIKFNLQAVPLKLTPIEYKKYFIPGKILEINADDKVVFDQILSTFKSLSTTSTDERATLTQYLIDQYFAQSQKYGYSREQIQIIISKIEGNFAFGSSKIDDAGGDGWYATKINGQWKIIEQTQEPPSCELMTQYNFPKSIYGECVTK
jgi:hypothetical protein